MPLRRMKPFHTLSSAGKRYRLDVCSRNSELLSDLSIFNSTGTPPPEKSIGRIDWNSRLDNTEVREFNNVNEEQFITGEEEVDCSQEENVEFHDADDDGFDSDFNYDSEDSEDDGDGVTNSASNEESEDPDDIAFKKFKMDRSLNIFQLLVHWALLYRIKMNALSALLKILRKFSSFSTLPKDARTLLETPLTESARAIDDGEYFHFGLLKSITPYLKLLPDGDSQVKISVNIDGLPLFKSSESQLWPILITIIGVSKVFCVGLYQGDSKPESAENYLGEFIQELKELIQTGIRAHGRLFDLSLFCVVCDAPAKSFILGCKGHTGYSSCTRCTQKGKHSEKRVIFPDLDSPLRTHDDFLKKTDSAFHHIPSVFEDVPGVNMVRTFALDYMHLVCLGVMRTMLKVWIIGKTPFKISSLSALKCSEQLFKFRAYIPAEFCRKPRSLDLIKRWKATELRQFLLYTGPVVLQTILDPPKYKNFLVLSVAMRILLSPSLVAHSNFVQYARELLRNFVESFKELYSENFLTHNFHNLIHLADDAETFGNLDLVSAFKFENYLQTLKSFVRKPSNILQQIIRRVGEINANCKLLNGQEEKVICEESTQSVAFDDTCAPHYSSITLSGFKIAINVADSCVGTTDSSIVIVKGISFSPSRNCLVIIGQKFKSKTDFFMRPCKSSLIGIHQVSQLSEMECWPVSDISVKYTLLPFKSEFVALPILHTGNE